MSFLNTGFTPTVSARLTKAGRNAIAKGDFLISYFSIGDSEYNYNLTGKTQNVLSPLDKNTNVKYPLWYTSGTTTYGIPIDSPDSESVPCRNVMATDSGWTSNVVWDVKPIGVNDRELISYVSNKYTGVKNYLGYTSSSGQTFLNSTGGTITGTTIVNTSGEQVEIIPEEQKCIAILHYSQSGITNDPYRFFKYDDYISTYTGITSGLVSDINYFNVTIPNLMYHRSSSATTGATFYMSSTGTTNTVESTYNTDFQLEYRYLLDSTGTTANKVGKVFYNQKIVVFDDEEIVTALDTGATKNYTLTAPKVNTVVTTDNSITDLTTGKTIWVTYLLSGGTVSGDLPCNYFMKVTGTTNPENITVKFDTGGFKHLNNGYDATQFHILYQLTNNGVRPSFNSWKIRNYTSELSSINDLKTGFTFTINQTKYDDVTTYTSSLSSFGNEVTYTGGTTGVTMNVVRATDIQEMNFLVNLPDGKFNTSQNPTCSNCTPKITEVALLNSNKETLVIGKLSSPVTRVGNQVISVKLDF